MREVFRVGPLALLRTPGADDSLALRAAESHDERSRVGQRGGFEHIGVHVEADSAEAVDDQVRRVKAAGGRVVERGEHRPGLPYAYVADPDGYTIEISGPPGMPSSATTGDPGEARPGRTSSGRR